MSNGLWTIRAAALWLGKSHSTIYRWIRSGKIKSVDNGDGLMVPNKEVEIASGRSFETGKEGAMSKRKEATRCKADIEEISRLKKSLADTQITNNYLREQLATARDRHFKVLDAYLELMGKYSATVLQHKPLDGSAK